MYIPFSDINLQSRVWIYQADRKLTDDEVGIITQTLKASLDGWEAHGKPLTASGKVFEHRFVVIAVDENDELPSGCSIDKSVHWIQAIGHSMQINFMDRSIAYVGADHEIHTVLVPNIKRAVAEDILSPETIIFDNQVLTKAQWMTHWKTEAGASWLSRYFGQKSSV
ncbi:hypothetical protein [Dyadobacter sp. CY326]|uniref:hypothetical protein n=1 Tax=Dyadobacter sp. CY326 TaxID=2907300 RepID=UPI001F4756F0|nr:hypothetical protein [Dyadobacter sp. CY326]MCE7068401.1 hypothetical protein [Dyadobacter sp. CY326]